MLWGWRLRSHPSTVGQASLLLTLAIGSVSFLLRPFVRSRGQVCPVLFHLSWHMGRCHLDRVFRCLRSVGRPLLVVCSCPSTRIRFHKVASCGDVQTFCHNILHTGCNSPFPFSLLCDIVHHRRRLVLHEWGWHCLVVSVHWERVFLPLKCVYGYGDVSATS